MILDQSHVNVSHDVPGTSMQGDRSTDNGLAFVRGHNQVESVDKGNGEWKVRTLFGFHLWQSRAEQSISFTRDRPSAVHAQRF